VRVRPLFFPIARLASRVLPAAPAGAECEAGELVEPIAFDRQLDAIGENWRCWRLRAENDRNFAFRLAVHLHVIALAVEDDLRVLDKRNRERIKALKLEEKTP
jgi:hypothetical protein